MNNKLFSAACYVLMIFTVLNFAACRKVTDLVEAKYLQGQSISSNYILSNHNPTGVDYILTGDFNVLSSGRLIIESGTTIQFMPNVSINVDAGRLEIRGTSSNVVTLQPMSDTPLASWKGIIISSFDFNEIAYANIKGAKTVQGNAAIYLKSGSSATIKNSIIEDTGCGIYEEQGALGTVLNNTYISVGNGYCEQ